MSECAQSVGHQYDVNMQLMFEGMQKYTLRPLSRSFGNELVGRDLMTFMMHLEKVMG